MAVHPKLLERATNILVKSEEEILAEIAEITNKTVLCVIHEQEQLGKKRESIIEILREKLGLEGEQVTPEVTESLSQQYMGAVTESEQETITFDTSLRNTDDTDEEKDIDSSTNSS